MLTETIKLNKILIKFFFQYILNILNNSNRKSKDFQSNLLKISNLSQNNINKEYARFLKFISKKYSLSETNILDLFESVFIYNVKLTASVFGNMEINIPSFESFWFKCLKYISKFFYEHPKILNNDNNLNSIKISLNEILNNVLFKFIPIKKIINIQNTQLDDSFVNFNLDNISGFDNTLIVSKINNDEYITPEIKEYSHELHFIEDNVNQENTNEEINNKSKNNIKEDSSKESKIINLNKSKPQFVFNSKYAKKNIKNIDDDINTHFF